MPTQQIYVSKEDMSAFQRAKELFDESLSSMITDYVKKLVEQRENELLRMKVHVIEIGEWPSTGFFISNRNSMKEFIGEELISKKAPAYKSDYVWVDWTIYATKKGKILVHYVVTAEDGEKSKASNYKVFDQISMDEEYQVGWDDFEAQPGYYLPGERMKSNFGELTIPKNFIFEALEKLGKPPIEKLDV